MAAIAGLLVIIGVSGLIQADATKRLWTSNRTRVEQRYYGASVDSLIAQRDDDRSLTQRRARISPPVDYVSTDVNDFHYGVVFYTGRSSVIGYVNLKGTETYQLIRTQMDIPGETGASTRAFWSAAGMVIEGRADTIPDPEATKACATEFDCGDDIVVEPMEYGTYGHFVYRLTASATVAVMLNEAHYSGWRAVLCDAESPQQCRSVPTVRGTSGQITLELPEGDWLLKLDYRLPGQGIAWLLFVLGALMAAAAGVWVEVTARRISSRDPGSCTTQPLLRC